MGAGALHPTVREAPRLAWASARAWSPNRGVAVMMWPGHLATVGPAIIRKTLYRLRRPEGISLITVTPLSRLEQVGPVALAGVAVAMAGLFVAAIGVGAVDTPTVLVLLFLFAPGLVQQGRTAFGADPEWRQTLQDMATHRGPDHACVVWVAGSAASWPERQGNLTALMGALAPHLDDKTVLMQAHTPALATVYASWGWTPISPGGCTLIRRPRRPSAEDHQA